MYLRPVKVTKLLKNNEAEKEVIVGYSHGIMHRARTVGEISMAGPAIIVERKDGHLFVIDLMKDVEVYFMDRNEK